MRVLTLTANLLAETTCTYAHWEPGGTVRAEEESFQVGGKGINVSRMLRRLGVDTEALCFPGGFTGARCEAWLRDAGIPFRAFPALHETRSGWVVRTARQPETTFLGRDNSVDAAAVASCARFLETADAEMCLAICGSIPGWESDAWSALRATLAHWAERSLLAVDTYGPALEWLVRRPCALVKINRREFAALVNEPVRETTDARMPALLEKISAATPVRRWIITDGGGTIWTITPGSRPASVTPPRIHEVSPTGSGDVFFAAAIEALLVRGLALEPALAFAVSLAAANASTPGVADFDLAPFGIVDRTGQS